MHHNNLFKLFSCGNIMKEGAGINAVKRTFGGLVFAVSSILSNPVTLSVPVLALPFVAGCQQEIAPTDERGFLYWQRTSDLKNTLKKLEKSDRIMDNAIISASQKLSRSFQPDYLPFPDVTKTIEPIKKTEEKKKIGVLEIYCIDSTGVSFIESYMTDFMVNCMLSDTRLGENFAVAERYKLTTVLNELDITLTSDFDPSSAIRRGYFKGVDAIVTGSIYPSSSSYEVNSEGKKVVSYKGGLRLLMRVIDVKNALVMGSSMEYIPWSPAVEEWVNKQVRRR